MTDLDRWYDELEGLRVRLPGTPLMGAVLWERMLEARDVGERLADMKCTLARAIARAQTSGDAESARRLTALMVLVNVRRDEARAAGELLQRGAQIARQQLSFYPDGRRKKRKDKE